MAAAGALSTRVSRNSWRFAVDPMQVLEDQQQRLHLALAQQQPLQRILRAPRALLGINVRGGVVALLLQQREQQRQGVHQRLVQRQQLGHDLLAPLASAVALLDLKVPAQQLDDRVIRGALAVGDRVAFQDQKAACLRHVAELPAQARLPDTWLADQRGHLPRAAARSLEQVTQRLELGVAPDKRSQALHYGSLETRARGCRARDLEDFHRLGAATHRHRPQGVELEIVARQARDRLRREHGAGGCELLHARGQMRGLADRAVLHGQVVADRADYDLPGVQADANLQVQAVPAPDFVGVGAHDLLHPQGRITGAQRVVLVGERRAEQRHHTVPEHLVHRTLVAVHRFHHPVQRGVEQRTRLFRVAPVEQFQRAADVGEQHGHVLALAFQVRAGGEDLLR